MNGGFLELVDPKRWQFIQDHFAEVIGACVRVIDTGGAALTTLSRPSRYCFETISSSPKAFSVCSECLLFSPQPHSRDTLLTSPDYFLDTPNNIHYDACPFYMNRIIVPVKKNKRDTCAYVLIGALILGKRREYADYFNLSKELEVDINGVMQGIEGTKVFSFQAVRSIVVLFQEMTNYIVQSRYEKIAQGKSESPRVSKPETHKIPHCVMKILQVLFETVSESIEAERVSLMLLDEATKTLTIKLSKGIPEQVIKTTHLKLGEGLAGWAAHEDKIIIIDKNFDTECLIGRMHLPQLGAAVIIPVKSGERIFGVLNAGTVEKKNKFTVQNIRSMANLARFTAIAIQNLSQPN